ncbi:Gamma-tubulin complex component 4 [Lobulomyces angularis]|nr:Gamma-tubulin complex component 4 [Lobulomyces angularis]
MLHQVLFSLSGFHCDDIIFKNTNLNASQIEILSKLNDLGLLYSQLKSQVGGNPAGIYYKALLESINEILNEYNTLIIKFEKKILDPLDSETNFGKTSLTTLLFTFEKYFVIFPALNELLEFIKNDKKEYFGSKLLNLMHTLSQTGIPIIQDTMRKIHYDILQIFYKQIIYWMFYGVLQDPHQEFFVVKSSYSEGDVSRSLKWKNEFFIDFSYIPKYIMVHTCEQILFAGKAVTTMEKKQELILDKVILNDILDQLVRTLPNAATNFEWDNRKFELSVQNWKDFVSNELWNFVVDNDLSENLNDFRSIFLLGEGQVFQEFISEYEESQSNALKNFSKSTEYDLNLCFRKSVRKFYDDDKKFSKFFFKFAGKSGNIFDNDILVYVDYRLIWPLDIIFSKNDIKIFNKAFSFLLKLKKCCLDLQKNWFLLNQCFNKSRNKSYLLHLDSFKGEPKDYFFCRNLILYFLENLWSFIQVDVLESNFQKLYQLFFEVDLPDGKKRVNKKDFESAVQLKDIILDSIMKGLFLEKEEKKENKINLKIMKMFTICDEFTTLINFKLEENHIGEYYSGRDDPKMLAVEFQEISDSLFRIFDGAKDGEISNYLELLLTRLDFNRWFSVGNLNLSI